MNLSTLIRKFKNQERDRILNSLPLELGATKAANLISPTSVVKWLSWTDRIPNIDPNWFPEKYLIISMTDSFTNAHVDFFGSSVYYHLITGEKIFYFLKPTRTNLASYTAYDQPKISSCMSWTMISTI